MKVPSDLASVDGLGDLRFEGEEQDMRSVLGLE